MVPHGTHLTIGSLLFEGIDQIDLTGLFEVLSRIPNSSYRIYGVTGEPVRDICGLRLTPDALLADAPQLDVLHVPGGFGQEALMDDDAVLGFLRRQAAGGARIFSVCTGALLLGTAGLLKGRRATTHWASYELLPYFGAIPIDERVVLDGGWIFAAGVTAGIDGALRLAAELRGEDAAKAIQLYMAYAPEPPFDSGTPATAPAAILDAARRSVADMTARREVTARRIAARLGIAVQLLEPSCRQEIRHDQHDLHPDRGPGDTEVANRVVGEAVEAVAEGLVVNLLPIGADARRSGRTCAPSSTAADDRQGELACRGHDARGRDLFAGWSGNLKKKIEMLYSPNEK